MRAKGAGSARVPPAPRLRALTSRARSDELNILWLVLAGIWLAIGYVVAAVILAITIIGIPFGVQTFKLAGYALWPFGRTLVQSATRRKGISVVGNIL
jgi:uncharacterized membrane protein YccF (DUF307 family)